MFGVRFIIQLGSGNLYMGHGRWTDLESHAKQYWTMKGAEKGVKEIEATDPKMRGHLHIFPKYKIR